MKIDKELDILCSEFVRRRAILRVGGCERCLRPKIDIQKDNGKIFPAWKQLDWCHLISRNYKSVRWNEDNGVGCCGGCHRYLDNNAKEKVEFIYQTIGEEKYNLLEAQTRPGNYIDKQVIKIYLKMEIEKLRRD